MNLYQFSKFCLASDIEFPELLRWDSDYIPEVVDITIRLGTVKRSNDSQFVDSQSIVGSVSDVADFAFYHGSELVVSPKSTVDAALLRTVILGPALCLLMKQKGLLVLHASCVNINNHAVAFMGGPGWGKSTMVTAFHRHGYAVLTDDVMPVEIVDGIARVLPSYPQFKVSSEALISLGEDVSNLSTVYQSSHKLSYKFSRGFQTKPLPLEKIYILRKGAQHKISSVTPQQAFGELIRHTRAINLVKENRELATQHFQLSTQLLKLVEFKTFTRKPALEDLPDLIKLVEADINASAPHQTATAVTG